MLIKLRGLLVPFVTIIFVKLTSSAPKMWPYMKTYDIWESNKTVDTFNKRPTLVDNLHSSVHDDFNNDRQDSSLTSKVGRKAKVINFFSFPLDDECLADDGRRIGMCMNVYECRIQGGSSRGDCALGFGVCCVTERTCDEEVEHNITYFVSPKFPALMPGDKEHCAIKIKLASDDISQIRLDFVHFTLSQPNRRTGVCDSDIFSIEGGAFPFILCGQNSGQHMFYDLGSPNARAESQELKININLNKQSLSPRLWEIRISQIPFSSKAPSGCMQYFTGSEGIIQTFNFADNGRHLANQKYRACVRQETGLCSIQYEPCNDQSFRIGPMPGNGMPGGMLGSGSVGNPASDAALADGAQLADETASDPLNDEPVNPAEDDLTQMDPTADDGDNLASDDGENPASDDGENPAADDGTADGDPATDDQQADETQQQDEPQDDPPEEGSGGSEGGFFGFPAFSFPAFPSFFRSFNGRQGRQLYSPCTDRITLPCIVEDFIGTGMGDVPTCLPVHCGNSLCPAGVSSCKIETSVTPFHIGVNFGDGLNNKGSPEDNIGACLRYRQLPCA